MGFGFRKSFSSGPFRFTVSKSGISSSFGVKGARVTMGPRGTHISVGSHGFYYRERIGPSRESRHKTRNSAFSSTTHTQDGPIPTAQANDLADSSSEQLLLDLNRRAKMFNLASLLWPIALACLVGSAIGNTVVLLPTSLIVGAVAISVSKRHRQLTTTELVYELNEEAERKFNRVRDGVDALSRSQRVWRVERRQFTSDWKHNAGARTLNDRRRVATGNSLPPRVQCNINVPMINCGDQRLYLFPDRILLWQDSQFGAIRYEDLRVEASTTRFIESEGVASDTEIVGQNWRYPNKNGGPDRRFNNNYQIPVVLYGELGLTSATGLNLIFHTSRTQAVFEFQRCLGAPNANSGHNQHEKQEERSHRTGKSDSQPPKPKTPDGGEAWRTLELEPGASREQIAAAYRRLAVMYHPDKVAHLAPEFRGLAEERMKQINLAYKVLLAQAS